MDWKIVGEKRREIEVGRSSLPIIRPPQGFT